MQGKYDIEMLIAGIRRRPRMYVDEVKIEYIYHFLFGYSMGNREKESESDKIFRLAFSKWFFGWIIKNLDSNYENQSFVWYHMLIDVTNSAEEAVELFFQLSEKFFEEYHNNRISIDTEFF